MNFETRSMKSLFLALATIFVLFSIHLFASNDGNFKKNLVGLPKMMAQRIIAIYHDEANSKAATTTRKTTFTITTTTAAKPWPLNATTSIVRIKNKEENKTGDDKFCSMKFTSTEENAAILGAYERQKSGKVVNKESFNRHEVLHFFLNTPYDSKSINGPSSPIRFENPLPGGYWKPKCTPKCYLTSNEEDCGIAILVPYRGRTDNLAVFLPWMHTFLQDQQREYRIVLVEQADDKLFNRAKLFNVAVTELRKRRLSPNSCYALHDIDKIPEDTRHIYECSSNPRHMIHWQKKAKSAELWYYPGRHYMNYVGGVLVVSFQQYNKTNGMSNKYFGWGREDDDFNVRITAAGMQVEYGQSEFGKYLTLPHDHDRKDNKMPFPLLGTIQSKMLNDGLNSLNYTAEVTFEPMFTRIRANL